MPLRDLINALSTDRWREATGFSTDIDAASTRLLESVDDASREATMAEWLGRQQPCLFGRLAARGGGIEYCFITDADISSGDETVAQKIRTARQRWWRAAFRGQKSGFVVVLASDRVMRAEPNPALLAVARRFGTLYLRVDPLENDSIYLEEVFLQVPGDDVHMFRWRAGVNVFASAGDRRWWHDHRIPGGLAFSVNSVGHLMKATRLIDGLGEFYRSEEIEPAAKPKGKVAFIADALQLAMSTIDNAFPAVSGKATMLKSLDAEGGKCPHVERNDLKKLEGKSHCSYVGYYHTDQTLPAVYFRPDVERPVEQGPIDLDFTYLFASGLENPDHDAMGSGEQILEHGAAVRSLPVTDFDDAKRPRFDPEEVSLESRPDITEIL